MEAIEWKDEYNVNINFVDEHHRKFLEILNELGELTDDKCNESITKLFYSLVHYAENFLIREEIYFKKYPNFKQHQEAHNRFIEQISKLQADYKEGKQGICREMYTFLLEWFQSHVLKYDKDAVDYLKDKGIR